VYTGALWVDPQEESRLLIASTHLCRTTNDGTTVTRIVAPEDLLFTDFHAIVSQPGSSTQILVGHDQGLRRIPNYTAAFVESKSTVRTISASPRPAALPSWSRAVIPTGVAAMCRSPRSAPT
jgi:hypothetical protein